MNWQRQLQRTMNLHDRTMQMMLSMKASASELAPEPSLALVAGTRGIGPYQGVLRNERREIVWCCGHFHQRRNRDWFTVTTVDGRRGKRLVVLSAFGCAQQELKRRTDEKIAPCGLGAAGAQTQALCPEPGIQHLSTPRP